MKVAFSAYVVDPKSGSEPGNAWRWISGAHENGAEVIVITTPKQAQNLQFQRYCGITIIEVQKTLPEWLEIGMFGMYVQAALWQRRIGKMFSRNQIPTFDVGHHVSWGSFRLGTGFVDSKVPYVFGPCGFSEALPRTRRWLGKYYIREYFRSLLAKKIFSGMKFTRRSIQSASIALAANDYAFDFAVKNGSPRVLRFLPEGIDLEKISNSTRIKARENKVIWVGRFLPIKGASLAITAFAHVKNKIPDAKMIMIGDGPDLQNAKRLAHKLNLSSDITFLGQIPWAEVQEFYEQGKCLLFSTLRDSTGAQVLEAAAKGLPVVSTTSTGISEWFSEPGGHFLNVQKGSDIPIELSQRIIEIFEAPLADWRVMSTSAINFANEHTWMAKTEAMFSLYLALGDSKY